MKRALYLCLLLAASSSSGEVRITVAPDGPTLMVRPSQRGVWTPMPGADRGELLNPGGDSLGDGFPAHARSSGRLLASWTRPSSGSVAYAEVDSGVVAVMEFPAPGAVGVP